MILAFIAIVRSWILKYNPKKNCSIWMCPFEVLWQDWKKVHTTMINKYFITSKILDQGM